MIKLECTRGTSNKYYNLDLQQTNGRVTVTGYYGAIGQAPKEHPIYDGDNLNEAVAAMQKKQIEKEKKGYVIVGRNGFTSPRVEKKTMTSQQSGR